MNEIAIFNSLTVKDNAKKITKAEGRFLNQPIRNQVENSQIGTNFISG